MEFRVHVFDYGRSGTFVKEPRTGLTGEGETREDALDDLSRRLKEHMRYDFVPPAEGPVESIVTLTV